MPVNRNGGVTVESELTSCTFVCSVACIHGVVTHLDVIRKTLRTALTSRHVVSLYSTESYVFFDGLLPYTMLTYEVVPTS